MSTFPTEATEGDLGARLREAVLESIRARWIRPRFAAEPLRAVAPDDVLPLSRQVLDTMLTRQFRVGKLPPPATYDELLQRVSLRIRRAEPINVSIGYSPLKNPNSVAH